MAEPAARYPITGSAGCCARVASGHTAAPPPMTLMKSRRLIGRSEGAENAGVCPLWVKSVRGRPNHPRRMRFARCDSSRDRHPWISELIYLRFSPSGTLLRPEWDPVRSLPVQQMHRCIGEADLISAPGVMLGHLQ